MVIEFTALAITGLLISRIKGWPTLLLIENAPHFRDGATGFFARFAKSKLASLASAILTNNDGGRQFILSKLRCSPGRVMVGPYLTSCPIATAQDSNQAHEVKLKRAPDRINILFLNSVTERKGLLDLARAVALMAPYSRKKLLIHVVGSGDQLETVRRYVLSNEIAEEFQFYGSVAYEHVGSFYRDADVYISPTRSDYRSLGGFEAISHGLPVLISIRDGACDEVVQNGVNGWRFDPLDRTETAETLRRMVDHPACIAAFRVASENLAPTFDVASIVSNILAAAKMAAGARKGAQI